MHDLNSWSWLLNVPQTVRFERMTLLGGDIESPVTEGIGEVHIESNSRFRFQLTAANVDRKVVDERQQRLRDNPYDGLARFRVQAWDAEDRQWHLGWTEPEFSIRGQQVVVRGLCEGLSVDVPTNSESSSTTTLYRLQNIRQLMSLIMLSNAGPDQNTSAFRLDDSSVELTYDPKDAVLLVSATHSNSLPPTYTENWLGEPLRILLGHLVFPSLVARDVSGAKTFLSLRRTPNMAHTGGIGSHLRYRVRPNELPSFWKSYEELLQWIARSRGKDGKPNFESNSTTRLCEEIVQAEYLGSRWILALTLASAVESQARKLADTIPTPDSEDAKHKRDQLIEHIQEWSGTDELKGIAVSAIRRSVEKTTPKILRALCNTGAVTKEQIAAWNKVRNSVVHGHLISPYSSEKEDAYILAMAKMFHALTNEVILASNGPQACGL
jgi:hypothetical protein